MDASADQKVIEASSGEPRAKEDEEPAETKEAVAIKLQNISKH